MEDVELNRELDEIAFRLDEHDERIDRLYDALRDIVAGLNVLNDALTTLNRELS